MKQEIQAEEVELRRVLGENSPECSDSNPDSDSFDEEFQRLVIKPRTCLLTESDSGGLPENHSLSVSLSSDESEPCLSVWGDKRASFLKIETKLLRGLQNLHEQLTTYICALPVLGYNSSKYDLNLIMASLVVELKLHREKNH